MTDLEKIELELRQIVKDLECRTDSTLLSAIEYSLFPGGKRIRPLVCIKAFRCVGGTGDEIFPYALSLEMIHTASLIKDDLPAMDNHQERRGKPSVWRRFGEATAIMAADMLSAEAYRILLLQPEPYPIMEALNAVVSMLSGQNLDCMGVRSKEVNELKTASLFEAAFVIGGIVGKGSDEQMIALRRQGYRFGLEFQLLDDVRDREEDGRIKSVVSR